MMTATVTESEKEIRPVSGWRVVAAKELADHLLSGRFIVLMAVLGIATAAAASVSSANRVSLTSRCSSWIWYASSSTGTAATAAAPRGATRAATA